jgi:hypothetical protein
MRLRTGPNGVVQIFLHGPRPGRHELTLKVGADQAHATFDVS